MHALCGAAQADCNSLRRHRRRTARRLRRRAGWRQFTSASHSAEPQAPRRLTAIHFGAARMRRLAAPQRGAAGAAQVESNKKVALRRRRRRSIIEYVVIIINCTISAKS